jgi:hypothetical protein
MKQKSIASNDSCLHLLLNEIFYNKHPVNEFDKEISAEIQGIPTG